MIYINLFKFNIFNNNNINLPEFSLNLIFQSIFILKTSINIIIII